MILLGSYDATRVNMLRHTAQASAYEGARRSIVPGATIEDVEADCRAIAATCGARDIRIQVIPAVITSDTKEVEVTVEIPLRSNTLVSSPFFGDMVLRGKTKFLRELK